MTAMSQAGRPDIGVVAAWWPPDGDEGPTAPLPVVPLLVMPPPEVPPPVVPPPVVPAAWPAAGAASRTPLADASARTAVSADVARPVPPGLMAILPSTW
jgi:hypothetical protein